MSAMKPATSGAPYALPPEPNRLPAILLALGVHALLLAFLWLGVSWQNQEPVAVEAEVWDMKVETAAAPPLPAPEPEPVPEPKPVPPPPKAVEPEPEPVKPSAADIRLERDKKLAELKKQREIAEEKKRELAEQKKKEDAKKLADQKEREKKEKAEADKKLADAKAAADKKKLAADKAAKAKADAAEQAKLDKLRADELKRMMGAAGSTGSAQKSSAPKSDAGYQAAIAAKVKSNMAYAGSTDEPGNPRANFTVEQLPTGEILSVRLIKSSGVPQFDDAVERAINKSSPLPKRKDGTVDRTVRIGFSMNDLD